MRMTASWFKVFGPTGYKVVARFYRARKRAPPLIVIPTASSVPSRSKPSGYDRKRLNQKTDDGKTMRHPA
jgi:hypothetical protein